MIPPVIPTYAGVTRKKPVAGIIYRAVLEIQ